MPRKVFKPLSSFIAVMDKKPRGIKGWAIVFLIYFILSAIIFSFFALSTDYPLIGYILISAALITLILMFIRKKQTRLAAFFTLSYESIFYIMAIRESIIYITSFPSPLPGGGPQYHGAGGAILAAYFMVFFFLILILLNIPWMIYIFKSKRMKNTFIK